MSSNICEVLSVTCHGLGRRGLMGVDRPRTPCRALISDPTNSWIAEGNSDLLKSSPNGADSCGGPDIFYRVFREVRVMVRPRRRSDESLSKLLLKLHEYGLISSECAPLMGRYGVSRTPNRVRQTGHRQPSRRLGRWQICPPFLCWKVPYSSSTFR